MNSSTYDLRYAVRKMLKEPLFSLVAILALALGIAANSAIFSVVDAVLLRPLPFDRPEQLVHLLEHQPESGVIPVAPANFVDWQQECQAFADLAAYVGPEGGSRTKFTLLGSGGDPERLQGTSVTGNFFQLFGSPASAGRLLTAEDIETYGDRVAMISFRLWQRRFGGDPDLVGQTLTVEGKPRTVVGVLPPGFDYPTRDVDLWLPLDFDFSSYRRAHFFQVVGRLAPGVDLAAARAEMDTLARRLELEYPDTNTNLTVQLTSLHDYVVGDNSDTLLLLFAAVGFVLLLTCANVASLMVARATARQGEIAMRAALGAGHWRIARQLLTESVLLASVAGLVSLPLAQALIRLTGGWAPSDVPRIDQIGLDPRVLLFTAGVTLFTAVLCGLAPILTSLRSDLANALREGGQQRGGDRSHRTRNSLVIGEVALSLILVVAAGLMIRSFDRLSGVDPGFEPRGALTFGIALPRTAYGEPEQIASFYRQLFADLEQVPGVDSVGSAPVLPLRGTWWSSDFTLEGTPPFAKGEEPKVQHLEVSPGYFESMGIPILAGRSFTDADGAESAPVAMINETFVRRFLAGRDPIGLRIKFALPEQELDWVTLVGVAGDARQNSLGQEVLPEVYVPLLQDPQPANTIVLRTGGDPTALIAPARRVIADLDPTLPIFDVNTTEEIVAGSLSRQRFVLRLLVAFALVALFLAAVGIYGVMSYTVTRRTREIGLRMALGAETKKVAGWVVLKTLRLVVFGLGLGILGAVFATRLLSAQLYGVSANDPLVFALVTAILAAVAVLAALLPAWRATRVDPLTALHSE